MIPIRSSGAAIVVGPSTPARWMMMQQLLAEGRPVLTCSAQQCTLEEGLPCPLKKVADLTIAVPSGTDRKVAARIERCLRTGRFGYSLGDIGAIPAGHIVTSHPRPATLKIEHGDEEGTS